MYPKHWLDIPLGVEPTENTKGSKLVDDNRSDNGAGLISLNKSLLAFSRTGIITRG